MNSVKSLNSQLKPKGGTLIFYTATAFDPNGSYYVRCDKHPNFHEQIRINFIKASEEDMLRVAEETLSHCPFCEKERKEQQPRKLAFPEGAEL